MKKKTLIILTLVLLLILATKVQALEIGEGINPKEEKIETLLEINQNNTWKNLEVEKYNQGEMVIYKVGTHQRSSNPILVNQKYDNDKILRIVKNGYKQKTPEEIGVTNTDDAYIATKIAIDCVFYNTKVAELENKYRIKENLTEEQNTRANRIIESAKILLEKGLNGKENYQKLKSVIPIGELDPDVLKPEYVSQLYRVSTTESDYHGYTIKSKSQSPIAYYIANANTGEEQEKFGAEENEFRIMVPKEYQEEAFELQVGVELSYNADKNFLGTDGNGRYIIFTNVEEKQILKTKLMNSKSTLTVNFVDDETEQHILGGKVKIKDVEYEIDRDRKMLLWGLPKEKINIEILEIPKDYIIEQNEIIADIKYREDHIEDIKVSHKKGNVKIITLAGQATYEIYEDNNMRGSYSTDEEGNVLIEGINTGKCIIKQTKVKEGYELVEDIEIPIIYGQTFVVTVNNRETEKIKPEEPTEPKGEEPEEPEEPTPPKEEKPEQPEEPMPPKEEEPEQPEEPTPPKEEKPEQPEEPMPPKEEDPEQPEEPIPPKEEEPEQPEEPISPKEEEPEQPEEPTPPKEEPEQPEEPIPSKEEPEQPTEITRTTLPRTGNDYFVIKLILTNTIIFGLTMYLIKKIQDKKTDCQI